MAIADGRTTLEKVRASTNDRQKVHKAKSQSVITDEKPEPVAPRVTGSQEVDVEQQRARMAALDPEPAAAPEPEPEPDQPAATDLDRRIIRAAGAIRHEAMGLSRGDTEQFLAALRDQIDSIEREALIPNDLSIPDFLRRTEAAA
jgi:hypothetical protein